MELYVGIYIEWNLALYSASHMNRVSIQSIVFSVNIKSYRSFTYTFDALIDILITQIKSIANWL